MSNNENLGFRTAWGTIESFENIGWGICAWCDCEITEDNDSGIDVFVLDGMKCQRICKSCNNKPNEGIVYIKDMLSSERND